MDLKEEQGRMATHRNIRVFGVAGATLLLGMAVADVFGGAPSSFAPPTGEALLTRPSVLNTAEPSASTPPGSPRFLALPHLPPLRAAEAAPFPPSPSVQAGEECPRGEISSPAPDPFHNFYFTRGQFSGSGSAWRTDFNKADRQFLVVLRRILDIDAFPCENPVALDDPELRKFPFLYMVEVGRMGLTRSQGDGLRSYLLAGGFVLMDDFWGNAEWNNAALHMQAIFPEYQIVDIPEDHIIFRIIYPIEEVLQVPCECRTSGGPAFYSENGGTVPYLRGIFDETGRLMVVMAWNSDLGDAWEWAEVPTYPWDRSNYAFQLAFNLITYSMTH